MRETIENPDHIGTGVIAGRTQGLAENQNLSHGRYAPFGSRVSQKSTLKTKFEQMYDSINITFWNTKD